MMAPFERGNSRNRAPELARSWTRRRMSPDAGCRVERASMDHESSGRRTGATETARRRRFCFDTGDSDGCTMRPTTMGRL